MDKNIEIYCIIPARFNSSRFPGKPFEHIGGKPMLKRVVDNALASKRIRQVIVAAYGLEVASFCDDNGIEYFRVCDSCKNGSEAVADVAKNIRADYVFELQGDQPLVFPEVIDEFLEKAVSHVTENQNINIVQPYSTITPEQKEDRDVVKVAVSHSGKFLNFSRLPINTGYRTLGLYLWKRDTLVNFSQLPVSDYETAEDTHLVRFVMNDMYVQGVQIDDSHWIEVDRPEHVAQVEKVLRIKGIK